MRKIDIITLTALIVLLILVGAALSILSGEGSIIKKKENNFIIKYNKNN